MVGSSRWRWRVLPLLLGIGLGLKAQDAAPVAASEPGPSTVTFNRDIRPILSDQCFQCHGPDSARRKAKLRLDLEEKARQDLGGRRAIVPGNLEASELYRRITSEDDTERMPPVSSGKSLTSQQIEMIGRWIRQGARWEAHWSFVPPSRSPLPNVKRQGWARNPIDAFILARLEREGLAPSPEADPSTLLRRVSLDLNGLPPTPEETKAFLSDQNPDAYERVVDRLLATSRFGERMAIRWINAARYADTNGYQTDGERTMWRWRDWVIDAYNRNLPFDRFTIEQLAGDLLPSPTLDQKIATGFNRNHRGNAEGGIIPEEYAVEYVVDRVETTATVWLGLTIGCARCHNHKFDPISQEEFYQLFAFFNNVPEHGRAVKYGNSPPFIKAPTRTQQEQLSALNDRLAQARRQMRDLDPEIESAQARWEETLRSRSAPDWFPRRHLLAHYSFDGSLQPSAGAARPATPAKARSSPRFGPGPIGQAIVLDGRNDIDAGDLGAFGFLDRFSLGAWIRPDNKSGGTILSRMLDEPRGEGYSIALIDGKVQVNLVKRWLDDAIRVETAAVVPLDRWSHVLVSYDGSRLASGIAIYLNGRKLEARVLLDELNQTFQTREPFRIGGGGGPQGRFQGAIDEVRIHDAPLSGDEVRVQATVDSISTIASIPRERRTAVQALKLRSAFLESESAGQFGQLRSEISTIEDQIRGLLEVVPTTMVMEERPKPREAHVLVRGQYDRPGPRVAPGVPASLSRWPSGAPLNRLGLARWLVDPANPLTSRVEVNRLWQMLFGNGLVKTVEDFGAQGEWPSHPELLDWLATEFRETGWDTKRLIRTIVTSSTYRQSSRISPELHQLDPENRLLARGPRHRLSAEMIRDQALALGGLLVERVEGPSVKPYQPQGLWDELGDATYVQDHGPNLYRRGLYTFWKRTVAPPSMATFDAPGRETCTVREARTNTPLQALDLLNDTTFVEAARAFAERIMRSEKSSPQQRISFAFQAATARQPKPDELAVLLSGYHEQYKRFQGNPAAAKELLAIGESPADARLDPVELAAYTTVAQVILNLDETLNKE